MNSIAQTTLWFASLCSSCCREHSRIVWAACQRTTESIKICAFIALLEERIRKKVGEKRNRAVSVGLQKRGRNVLAPRFHEAWKSAQYHRDQPEFSVIYILSFLDETVLTGSTLKSRRQFKVERNFSLDLEPIPGVFCKICPLVSLSNGNKLITPQAELPIDSPEYSVALTVDIQLSVLNLGLKAVECIPPGF